MTTKCMGCQQPMQPAPGKYFCEECRTDDLSKTRLTPTKAALDTLTAGGFTVAPTSEAPKVSTTANQGTSSAQQDTRSGN